MRIFFVMLLALFIIPHANADWFYSSKSIVVNFDISSYADIIEQKPGGYIESATINLSFFPKSAENQQLVNFETEPESELKDGVLEFRWKEPEERIEFSISADVKTTNAITEISHSVPFPIIELPKDVLEYTKPSFTIDSDDEGVIRLASELVKGENDLYRAVFKVADWTKNNVNYDLSSLTAKVSQKASWVLRERQGVCDELTSLFIAMLRSLGIPARFVSGISYTNSDLFAEKWGPHGWAEVYFPGYGWVPFDVTYGEFGYIDPTHIKFKDAVDPAEPSVHYQWFGHNAVLKTKELDIKTRLVKSEGEFNPALKVDVSVLKDGISFGSYNLLTATIENLNDYYYATEVYLSKPKDVEIIGSEPKSILLLPHEKKKLFWVLRIGNDLDKKYEYTFPLVVSTLNNVSSQTSFTASIREKDVSFSEVNEIIGLLKEEEQKTYSGNVLIGCAAGKDEFYDYEEIKLECDLKNTGNVYLDNLEVCLAKDCSRLSLGISQERTLVFNVGRLSESTERTLTLRNDFVSKADYIKFRIDDKPMIEIEGLQFPENVSYSDNFTVSFTAAKKSKSNPKNVEISLAQNGMSKDWKFEDFAEDRRFILEFTGKQMKYRENKYRISVDYEDALGKKYSTTKEFSIKLDRATLVERLMLSFNAAGDVDNDTIIVMLLTGIIAFIAAVLVLFKRGKSNSKI